MDAAVERVEDIHAAIFAEETQQAYPELHAARARHNRARRPLRFSGTGYRATVDVSSALIGHGAVHRGSSQTSGAQTERVAVAVVGVPQDPSASGPAGVEGVVQACAGAVWRFGTQDGRVCARMHRSPTDGGSLRGLLSLSLHLFPVMLPLPARVAPDGELQVLSAASDHIAAAVLNSHGVIFRVTTNSLRPLNRCRPSRRAPPSSNHRSCDVRQRRHWTSVTDSSCPQPAMAVPCEEININRSVDRRHAVAWLPAAASRLGTLGRSEHIAAGQPRGSVAPRQRFVGLCGRCAAHAAHSRTLPCTVLTRIDPA
ncbi:hypothetical protein AURDEDRAFT_177747 [Auricularia subglabra TFB-10046 SS5]|uniref:Uncharacterized protein n=1 Tax=Auricularia subglabra (strain TFB-10046 / SS5) TaxID=717982 RepID=J0D3B7_AURST|nr:hypothetical protein AURDEDRAFT_177747 [Auricularia subglabra TFB-10046 SS5]